MASRRKDKGKRKELASKKKNKLVSEEAKVWLLFINAGILPTRHLNNISLDRMSIIYCIFKGIKFNVGRVLNEALRAKIKEEKIKLLWFPTLITELCKNMGVCADADVLVTQVGHHITETVVEVNIKVPNETVERGEHVRARVQGRYSRPHPSAPESCGPMQSEEEYIKTYMRMQHLYMDSRADYMCDVLARLTHRAKLTMPEPHYRCSGNFDSEGFLLDVNGERVEVEYDDEEEAGDDVEAKEAGEDVEASEGSEDWLSLLLLFLLSFYLIMCIMS